MHDGDIKIINGKEYKFITLRNRSKYVSKDGDLVNPFRNQKASIHYNADGYPCAGGGVPVHLYVAYAWVDGHFDGAEVNHKDFDRNNNNYQNLEWVTHADNVKYSVKNNSEVWNNGKSGIHNGRAKFTEDEIKYIRELYRSGMSVFDIIRQLTGLTEYEDQPENSPVYFTDSHCSYSSKRL